jgi:rhodanese-related sulfurtransferase
MKRLLPRAALCAGALAGLLAWPACAEVINIDNAELARLTAKGIPLIDIRTAGEWKSSGVIAGSRLLTFFDERGNANPAQWLASAKGVAKPGQPVILICRSGNRTRAATQFLSDQAGYRTVYNVSGGLNGWLAEKRPVIPAEKAVACAPGVPC